MPTEPATTNRYVLDACALIAYLNNETGAERVETLLTSANDNVVQLFVSSVNVYEVFYDCLKRDQATALQLVDDIYSLPLTIVETVDRPLMRLAGAFKTTYHVSMADSIALALAQQLNAALVSSDHHEFASVERDGQLPFHWIR